MSLPDAVTTIWWSTVFAPAFTAFSIARENRYPTRTTDAIRVLVGVLSVYYYKSELDLLAKLAVRFATSRPLLIAAVGLPAYTMYRYPTEPQRILPTLVLATWLRLLDRPYPLDQTEDARRAFVQLANKSIDYQDARSTFWPDLARIRGTDHGKARLLLAAATTLLVHRLSRANGLNAFAFRDVLPALPKWGTTAPDAVYDCSLPGDDAIPELRPTPAPTMRLLM